MNGISRETYEQMDQDSKLNVLFDYALESHKCACDVQGRIEKLEKKVDRRKRFDTSVSAVTGVIGGFLAVIGMGFWDKR